jgi:CheY-like chemotaxis protein
MHKILRILLVEDNPADARLVAEVLKVARPDGLLDIVRDGVEATDFVFRRGGYASAPRPDLILLDLNLPKKSGHEVLAEIKGDKDLRSIPVVILSSSEAPEDINGAYSHYANCYVAKPIDFRNYQTVVASIQGFWSNIAQLPPG